jgi:hypothetical protein
VDCTEFHPLVYECNQLCFDLMMKDLIEVKAMRNPSHVRLVGNELVDGEARYASLNSLIFDRPLSPCDFQSLARPVLSRRSGIWPTLADLITPFCRKYHNVHGSRVRKRRGALLPLALYIYNSTIMSRHSSARLHLDRFRIVEDPMCVCLKDYETVDHLIWHCERLGSERHRLIDALSKLDVPHGTPVRDLCGLRKSSAIKRCLDFLESFKIGSKIFVSLDLRRLRPAVQ